MLIDIKNFYSNNKKIIYRVTFWTVLFLCFVVVFGGGLFIGEKLVYQVPQPGTIDFSLFWDVYNKLQKNFIDPSKIDDQKIIYGAIQGMTDSLGDPYTSFFDPEQAKRFQQDLSGSFEGIGVEIGIKKGFLTVVAPLKDTPAEKAGLKSGDIISKIDTKNTANISIDQAVSLIRGEKGTSVTLTVSRDEWDNPKDIKITREKIIVPTIIWSLKDGNVAYIQIFQFGQTLLTDFQKIALEILQSGTKKIILDLRDNPGGYLEVAQELAGWFLQKNQIVTIEDFGKGRTQQIYETDGNSVFLNYPTVVLINQGSASASEILAGALRDNRGVKLVGEKSFGKGSVQEVINLPGGSSLKITIAHWLTPKGNLITDTGLTPDIKIDITNDDISTDKDPQLIKALEILSGL
jgi:carboxyl-terminal processing protease